MFFPQNENLQNEKAFQKQPTVFLNKKPPTGGGVRYRKVQRYVRKVGLGFRTPKDVSL